MRKANLEFSTGLSSLDNVLTGVRPGDNLVWQVDSVDDYVPFVHHFCRKAQQDQQSLIYFRFADHENLLPEGVTAEVFQLHPEQGLRARKNCRWPTIPLPGASTKRRVVTGHFNRYEECRCHEWRMNRG